MAKQKAGILDFGSSKITVMIAENGINNTFNILGTGNCEYDGFSKGEFFDEEQIAKKIAECLKIAETNSRCKIKKLYVGVPAEFSYCTVSKVEQSYNKRRKIKESEIYDLFDKAQNFKLGKNDVIINRSPINFVLDDNRSVIDFSNIVTSKIEANISFVICDCYFIKIVKKALASVGIVDVEYISSALAQCLYLLEPEVRDNNAILIDVGYITSSVSVIKGDGLVALYSFSVGGGHITGDLSQVLKISFSEAENLKRKAVLSLDASDDDFYEVSIKGNLTTMNAKLVNEIITSRLELIGATINKCLNKCGDDVINYLPIYLTGGGISYLKGGKDYISKLIGKNIEIVSPIVPQLSRPHFSSTLALLEMALKQEKANKKNFFQRLFNR